MMTVSVPGLTIQQDIIPVSSVVLSSNIKTLGSTTANTTLNVTWTPKTTMDPSGKGLIQIGVPLWYNISGTGQSMYSTAAVNQCTSPCMRITSSSLQNQAIYIVYDNMQPQCIQQQPITLLCSQFYTPITPDLWPGFSITTFDSQKTPRIIEQTTDPLSFDATQYGPMLISPSNFVVNPANTMIATYSTWTIVLSDVNIPLQTQCWIKIYLPPDLTYATSSMQASGIFIRPDLSPSLTNADLNIIYRNASIPKSSVTFDGCHSEPALGKTPFGRLDISKIETQSQIKDSGTFQVSIYKDKALTKLIAVLAQGVSISGASLQPGAITNASMIPADYRVQHITQITITFTISHTLLESATIVFSMPSGLTTPGAGSQINIQSQSSPQKKATMYPGGLIQIDNFVPALQQIPANQTISVTLFGIQNQNSVRDAGSFKITTMNMVEGALYVVDQSTIPTSYFATTGKVIAVGRVEVSNPTNYARANIYSLTFTLEDDLPKAGYIQVQVPNQISLSPSSTQSSGSCRVYTCTFANSTTVTILMQQGLSAGQQMTLQIGGVVNPRSLQPSDAITVTTLDTDAESQIDSGYGQSAVMQIAGAIQTFSVQQSSFVNGAVNTYQFSVQAQIPIVPKDKFQFTLPSQVSITQADCSVVQNLLNITCTNKGQVVTVEFNSFNSSTGAFTWSMTGVKNPPSTKTSSVFSSVQFIDSNGYVISALANSQTTVSNKFPAQLTEYSIQQGSLETNQQTTYAISFTTVNPLPTTGSIQLAYPQQISMVDGSNTKCQVATTQGQSACTVDANAKTVTVNNIFTQNFQGKITITLQNVRNAASNRPANGFVIQTYADASQIYIEDKLNDYILTPLFVCAYPCQTCQANNPAVCTSCWTNYDDPQYLMSFPDGSASCKSFCDQGFTTNGSQNKQCSKCDQSCKTCSDNFQVGDAKQCIDCSPQYPLQLSKTQTCLSSCQLGMYQSSNTSCSVCKAPCQGCTGTESTCTSCITGSKLANLFENQCISSCPPGYANVNNVCVKCTPPCALCSTTPASCTTCDGSLSRKFLYFNTCVSDCPDGSVENPDTMNCFACLPECDLCDFQNQTNCLRCKAPNVAYKGECIANCPEGWHVTDTGGACRPWQLSDIGIIYFPFLIAALIGSILCCFGMLQRRAHIHNGKMTMYSPQNTLTCIIVVVGCCQFFATICQWILSQVYGTTTFCILALLVTVAAIVVNIAFHRSFIVNFDSKRVPAQIDRKVRLNKMSKEEAQKYLCPQDSKFSLYKRLHKCTTYLIYMFSCCVNYKFNKLLYSFLFNRAQFQACFTRAKYYRKVQTQYMIVYLICIDLALICIDITALTQIEPGNQLYITIIETLVLSLLSILLGSVELWLLKRKLSYTEEARDKSKLKLGSGIGSESSDDKDLDKKFDKKKMSERRVMMMSLLRQVKNNKQLFLNNKLDELIHAFGDRRCSSMADLQTGWLLEPDPQERITWPVSPQLREDYSEMGFDLQSFGGKSKLKTTEDSTQVDLQLYQEALSRKQKGLFNQSLENDAEENRLKRVNRRRGRKNKFHAQIDQEDNQDLEFVEASDYDERLQIIKEHEIEEEEIRKIQSTKKAADSLKKVKEPYLSEQDIKDREAKEIIKKLQKESQSEQQKRDQEALKKNQEAQRLSRLKKDEAKAEEMRKAKESKQAELAKAKQQRLLEEQIQAPADAENRTFNENDILGDFERDAQGNVIRTGEMDRLGRLTNAKGYLIDAASGSLIETQTSKWMFLSHHLNSTGELPGSFALEKYNFNPHQLMGDFDFKNKKPSVLQTSKGNFSDKKGRQVNKFGWLVKDRHVSNFQGHKKFDASQLAKDGDLPKLFNFAAKEFDIKSVMGQFEKDSFGKILPVNTSKGLVDVQGRLVNEKGYLIDKKGNIIDTKGKIIWDKKHLKNGEFIKIFPFTKIDIRTIKADYDLDQGGMPVLQKLNGKFYDNQDRPCNQKGYLIDENGNIIDQRGFKVFDSDVLTNGEIPQVFRTNLKPPKSGSSMSRLLRELDSKREGETSLDSQMEDTPANYNLQNQRLEVNSISEMGSESSKQKPRKEKFKNVMVLQPTERDKNLAGAYGGQAIGSIRRRGVKYDKERLKDGLKFRVSSQNEHKVRAQLEKMVNSGSRMEIKSLESNSILNKSMSQGSRVKSNRGSVSSARPKFEERQRRLNKKHQDELFQPNLSSFLDDSEWDVSVHGKCKVQKQEKDYLSVMQHSSLHRDSPDLKKKSPREPSEKGPDRETILNWTDNPQIIHRGEILPFVTKVTRK